MKYLSIASLVVLAGAIVATDWVTAAPSPTTRTTSIFMTKNHNIGGGSGQFPAECRGVIATETIPAQKGDAISWKIKNGNGHDDANKCDGLDMSRIQLSFRTNVMGSKTLTARGSSVDGTVSGSASPGAHGYRVMYKDLEAGPDPEIIVDCPTCGPDGNK